MRCGNKEMKGFDNKYKIIRDKIYIFGADKIGAFVFGIAKENVIGFIDNSKIKQNTEFCGKKVFSLEEIPKFNQQIIVIAVSYINYHEVKEQIRKNSTVQFERSFYFSEYLPLYLYSKNNELFLNSFSVSLTQRCTLNCKDCSIMTPYLTKKEDSKLTDLITDLDLLFNKIDCVGVVGIVGGEPLLYPYLDEYLFALGKYRNRIIREAQIITNGTVIPDNKILQLIAEDDIEVSISDYSDGLPYLKTKIDKLIAVLTKNNIRYSINKATSWIDFGYSSVDNTGLSTEELISLFDSCKMPCRLLKNKSLYYCANAYFAIDAGLNEPDENNVFNLTKLNDENKREMLIFDQGYSKKGYVNMCKHCNGYLGFNHHYVKVAEQVEKH
jgi:organic radical activating enzyme